MINVSSFVKTLDNKPVAVFGLGISNRAAIKALVKAGVTVAAWDDHEERRTAAAKAGADIVNLTEKDMAGYACLVLAPGIPLTHPAPHAVVRKAQEAGIEILCDLEILHRCGHGRTTVGVTGTNGKSTTTALIGHVFSECGVKAVVGGNIGKAALDLTLPPQDGIIVLEMSSFQIDLCPAFAPDIGVHLNLTPDHLDRHGGMEGYAASKQNLFRGSGKAVIGVDDEYSQKMFETVKDTGQRDSFAISVKNAVERGVYVLDGELYDRMDSGVEESAPLQSSTLPGVHNHQNAAAAYAVARLLGIEPDAILEAFKTFPGLPHRQYLVRTINGVAYVNDSKATNADATARALACTRNVYWIVGGRPKDGGLDGLEPYMENIRHAYLIGEAAEAFGSWLDNHGVAHDFCGTLDRAAAEAHRAAQHDRGQPGGTGTVLLSPACSSFDQFRNFEERGDAFTALVEALEEDAG